MGFSRQSVMEALLHTQTLHAATDWILSHPQPSEEDQLMQAITMSLECDPALESSAVKKEEVFLFLICIHKISSTCIIITCVVLHSLLPYQQQLQKILKRWEISLFFLGVFLRFDPIS